MSESLIKLVIWPVVVLIGSIVFLLLFRQQIVSFLGRVRKVGTGGLETYPLPQESTEGGRKKVVDELMGSQDSQLVQEQQELIKEDLKKRGLEAESDAARVLIKHLAQTQIELSFEWAYGSIYGTQIVLLKKLNEVVGKGQPPEFVSAYLASVKERYPNQFKDWDLERYLTFLRNHLLITIKDGNYHITVKGVDFLLWLTRYGRSEDRPF